MGSGGSPCALRYLPMPSHTASAKAARKVCPTEAHGTLAGSSGLAELSSGITACAAERNDPLNSTPRKRRMARSPGVRLA